MAALPPVIVQPVRQHTNYACAIASLAMLIGWDYSAVFDYTHRKIGERIKTGLWIRDMKGVARHFGVPLVSKRMFDVDESTGLLLIRQGRYRSDHAVLLFNGTIYDPMDGQLWEPDAYLASYAPKLKARFHTLLTVLSSP